MNQPEAAIGQQTRVLSKDQRRFYRENGYLVLERIIPDDWLGRLRAAAGRITADTAAYTDAETVGFVLFDTSSD